MWKVCASEERFLRETDAKTVQAAIDSLGQEGGTVVIPRWNPRTGKPEWRFDRPLVLKSHVTLVVDNAVLVQETDCFCHLITAEPGAKDIALIGEGNALLYGGKTSRLRPSTSEKYGLPSIEVNAMCVFREVTGLTVAGLEIKDPHWASFVLENTENASLKNIRFDSYPLVPEEKGIFVRNGCRNIRIENLTGRTGDHTVEIAAEKGEDIAGVEARNVMTDPTRASIITIWAEDGGKVQDVKLDTIIDSSDFFEKARSAAALTFGRLSKSAAVAACGSTSVSTFEVELRDMSPAKCIRNVEAKNLYSRAAHAVEMLQPFSDTTVLNLMTFGDNIYAIGTRSTQPHVLENVVFDRVFYGAGSEPNCLNQFISRAAKDAKPVLARDITGFTVKRLYTQEEEA